MTRPPQKTLAAWVDGVSLVAPGIPNWAAGIDILREPASYRSASSELPAPHLLPPAESRRASRMVKLCLALGMEAAAGAGTAPGALASVFCSSNPDGHTIHAILESLTGTDRSISPTRFHNSVHNAAAGYWSIAVRSPQPYQALCAYDGTFAAALVEAATQVSTERQPVLMLAYDGEYPAPLHACRPIPDVGGIALVLSPQPTARSLAGLQIGLAALPDSSATAAVQPRNDAAASLARLADGIPALAGLPLLAALAAGVPATLAFDSGAGWGVSVQVQPC